MAARTWMTVGWAVGLGAFAVSCALLEARFETATPGFGYVDGCADVELQGAALGTDAVAWFGELEAISTDAAAYDTSLPEHAQDVGFSFTARTPARPDGQPVTVDITLTTPEREHVLTQAFTYIECPAPLHLDVPSRFDVAPGGSFEVYGCNLLGTDLTVRLVDDLGAPVAQVPFTSTCSTARGEVAVPDTVAVGAYWLQIEHTNGAVWGGPCPTFSDTAGLFGEDTDVDTGGGDTAVGCDGHALIVVATEGGAP